MKLYSYFRSSCAHRVRIALNLKGVPYELIPLSLIKNGGEQYSAKYAQLNPLSQVPYLLVDDQRGLAQSVAIIHFLDLLHPEPRLFPNDPYLCAKAEEIMELINSGVQPLQNLSTTERLKDTFKATPEQISGWTKFWIQKGLAALEKILEKTSGEFCLGNQLSVADVFLIPQIYSSQRFEVDLKPYPRIMKVHQHCSQLKPFVDADPFHQPDTPPDLKPSAH